MAFGLFTLLGCEYNDIMRDYAFTNFGVQGSRNVNDAFKILWNKLDTYKGETKSEKYKYWLIKKRNWRIKIRAHSFDIYW